MARLSPAGFECSVQPACSCFLLSHAQQHIFVRLAKPGQLPLDNKPVNSKAFQELPRASKSDISQRRLAISSAHHQSGTAAESSQSVCFRDPGYCHARHLYFSGLAWLSARTRATLVPLVLVGLHGSLQGWSFQILSGPSTRSPRACQTWS
jgi:hypothetical protein